MNFIDEVISHSYLLGGTGTGKTTFVRNVMKGVELYHIKNKNDDDPCVIYFDVKDDDSKLMVRQCERETFQNKNIRLIDVSSEHFRLNPFALPQYGTKKYDRSEMVAKTVSYIMDLFREIFDGGSQGSSHVQLDRIMNAFLNWLFSNFDSPTLADFHKLITVFRSKNKDMIKSTLLKYSKFETPELVSIIESFQSLNDIAWMPLFNRLDPFMTNMYLRRFVTAQSSFNSFDLFAPGMITVIRISRKEVPLNVIPLAMMTMVQNIYYAALYRDDSKVKILLILDEFQVISNSGIIKTILEQGRSIGLFVWLSHQSSTQIDDDFFNDIMSNTVRGNLFLADPSSVDVTKLARNRGIGVENLNNRMSSNPLYSIIQICKDESSSGVTISRIQKGLPSLNLSESGFDKFREIQSNLLQVSDDDGMKPDDITLDFRAQMDVEFLNEGMWGVLMYLYKNSKTNMVKICDDLEFSDRDDLREKIINPLQDKKLIRVASSKKKGCIIVRYFELTENCTKSYFDFDYTPIIKTDEGISTARIAVNHYRNNGCFVVPAKQTLDRNDRTDLVGFDYSTGESISIEIESSKEASSHHEQVIHNSKKWKKLGFDRCEFWSSSKKVKELVAETEKIKVFIV